MSPASPARSRGKPYFGFRTTCLSLAALWGGWLGRPLRAPAQPANEPTQLLMSSTPEGVASNGNSTQPAISIDGGFVVFESTATDIERLDGDRGLDIYLHEVATGQTDLMSFATSVNPGFPAVRGDGPSRFPSVSRGGQYIVFASDATNLTDDRNSAATDIFVHNRATGKNVLASLAADGSEGNGPSDRGVIDADGDVVAFQSLATDLLRGAAPPGGIYRIYIHIIGKGVVTRIDPPDGFANGDCKLPQLNADGSIVAFESDATNLSPLDQNKYRDVFVFDRRTDQITLVSLADLGRPGNAPSTNPRISPEGRYVAFDSMANNLVGGDTNDVADVFVRDLVTGRTERISLAPPAKQLNLASTVAGISFDGRFVGFVTRFPIDAKLDSNEADDFYVRDRAYSRTFLVSGARPAVGGPFIAGNGASINGSISGDGQSHVYESLSTDLLPGKDPTRRPDVYRAEAPQAFLGPFAPSNHVLIPVNGALRQFDLAGKATEKLISSTEILARSFAVDDRNALWVIGDKTLARFRALTLESAAADGPFINVRFDPGTVHALVAGGGAAFAAVGNKVWRFSADGQSNSSPIFKPEGLTPDHVSLALDPLGFLWACANTRTQHTLVRFDRALRRLAATTRVSGDPAETIACDPQGALYLRSQDELTKISRQGGKLWSVQPGKGGGLAVDGKGNAYTVSEAGVLGFHPTGRLFLRLKGSDALGGRGRVWMGIDGEGDVYVAEDGGRAVERFTPDSRAPLLKGFVAGALGQFGEADATGFLAANVHAPWRDADQDGFLNRDETAGPSNPFDPADPSRARRLPAVIDLTATLLPGAGRQVRVYWHSPLRFTQFFVFRDGRKLPQSPVSFVDALDGIIDSNIPGGLHVYRVVGQGLVGAGAGAGIAPDEEIPEPFSISSEASVSQGDGTVLSTASTPSPPDAVAFDSAQKNIYAVLSGGTLWKLGAGLTLLEETALPAEPFGDTETRGMAFDSAAGALYLLLGDGRLYRKLGAADPVLAFTLSGNPSFPLPEGFTGLAPTSGNGNDLFTTMAGPGVDCLIGFLRTSGAFKGGAEQPVHDVINTPVDYSCGVCAFGAAGFLAGLGIDLGGAPPSINRVVKLDLGANFDVKDTGASVSLEALGSFDIPGFDYISGTGLLVADRGGSRIAIVEALFPNSLQILEVTPPRGQWRGVTQGVQIHGTSFGVNPADLQVKFDGDDVAILSLQNGVITIDAPDVGEAREITVQVASPAATDFLFPGFTYGFRRGDANDDGDVNISDAIAVLSYAFSGGDPPPCLDAADPDDNEKIEVTDAVYILNFLFLAAKPAPLPPFNELGVDSADGMDGDLLGCQE